MDLRLCCLWFKTPLLIVLLAVLMTTTIVHNGVSAIEEADNDNNSSGSTLQTKMDFQKAQQRLMQILQEPSFSWILKKRALTQKNSTHNTHLSMDVSRSVESNKDNLLKENFEPNDRRSLLQANHAIAHLMYQGDMLLSKQQADHISGSQTTKAGQGSRRRRRQTAALSGAPFAVNRWDPKVPISYYFDTSIPVRTRQTIRTVLKSWQDNTCITFEEDGEIKPRVEFLQGPGCFSEVGKDASGKDSQHVSIGSMCSFFAPIAHEIGHVLGMIHTQARSDRDDYIKIEYKNVPAGMEDQFEKESNKTSSDTNVPYDYASLMHYTSYNQQTGKVIMVAKDPNYQHTMGNTYGPIFTDLLEINRKYNCDDLCSNGPSKICFNKGIRSPKNCSQCICPNGFGGNDCSRRADGEGGAPIGCGQTLSATADYQVLHGEVNASEDGQLRQSGCHWHIRAPAGKRVQIMMNSITGKCSNECLYGAIEIKFNGLSGTSTEADLSRGGARLCCPSHIKNTGPITSTGELVIISDYSQQGLRTFGLKYRAVAAVSKEPSVPLGSSFGNDVDATATFVTTTTKCSLNDKNNDRDLQVSGDFNWRNTTAPTDGSWHPCADYSSQCELLQDSLKHSCEDHHNSHYFMFQCPLACGLCPRSQDGTTAESPEEKALHLEDHPVMDYYNCVNYAPRCDNYSSHCSNGQVAQICPKTCGVCGADETTLQPPSRDRGAIRNRKNGSKNRGGKGGSGNTAGDDDQNNGGEDDQEDDNQEDDSNQTEDDGDDAGDSNTCEDKLRGCRTSRRLCFQKESQASMANLCARTCGQCGKKNNKGGRAPRNRPGRHGTRAVGRGDGTDAEGSEGGDDQEKSEDDQDTDPPRRTGGKGGNQNNDEDDNDGDGSSPRTSRGGRGWPNDGGDNTYQGNGDGSGRGGIERLAPWGGLDGQTTNIDDGLPNSGIGNTSSGVTHCNSDLRCINWNRSGICTISFMAPLREKYCLRFCGMC